METIRNFRFEVTFNGGNISIVPKEGEQTLDDQFEALFVCYSKTIEAIVKRDGMAGFSKFLQDLTEHYTAYNLNPNNQIIDR